MLVKLQYEVDWEDTLNPEGQHFGFWTKLYERAKQERKKKTVIEQILREN